MKIKKTQHYTEIKGKDDYGNFILRIQNDFSQLSLDTSNGDAYIDIDKSELKIIRDTISEMLGDSNQAVP